MNKKLLRKKLALMLANLKKKRPFYTEVEYLESDGNQYIDTGYTINTSTDEVIFNFQMISTTKYLWLMGEHDNGARFGVGVGDGTNLRNIAYGSTTYKVNDTEIYNSIHYFEANSNGVYLNGTQVHGFETFSSSSTVYLFKLNHSGANGGAGKIWRFSHKRNGVLIRDMIPVLDWNMTPCMYDKVSGELFYNQGTGNFSYGREIHEVDYLESTGTQYIDTGYVPSNTTGQYAKMQYTTVNNGVTFGGMVSGNGVVGPYYATTSGSYWWTRWGTNEQKVEASSPTTSNTYEMYLNFNNDRVAKVNNIVISGSLDNISGNYPSLTLFKRNYTVGGNLTGKVFNYKITEGTDLVRDYIPMVDEHGVGAMFDRVTHTIYDNAGTGAFKYPAREVEYLESDGARAIIAGITVDDTCGYDVKWMALNANDTIILGTKGSGDSRWVLSGNNNPNVNISWNTSSGGIGLGLNKIQTAQMNYFNDRKRILNDTPLTDITQTLSANASTYSVGIFGGYWGASQISLYSTCRIYYAKISKGTGLVRDFVPMFKDGSPCLFDKIGGLYYFGTGTGSFTTGKIVEPEYE